MYSLSAIIYVNLALEMTIDEKKGAVHTKQEREIEIDWGKKDALEFENNGLNCNR